MKIIAIILTILIIITGYAGHQVGQIVNLQLTEGQQEVIHTDCGDIKNKTMIHIHLYSQNTTLLLEILNIKVNITQDFIQQQQQCLSEYSIECLVGSYKICDFSIQQEILTIRDIKASLPYTLYFKQYEYFSIEILEETSILLQVGNLFEIGGIFQMYANNDSTLPTFHNYNYIGQRNTEDSMYLILQPNLYVLLISGYLQMKYYVGMNIIERPVNIWANIQYIVDFNVANSSVTLNQQFFSGISTCPCIQIHVIRGQVYTETQSKTILLDPQIDKVFAGHQYLSVTIIGVIPNSTINVKSCENSNSMLKIYQNTEVLWDSSNSMKLDLIFPSQFLSIFQYQIVKEVCEGNMELDNPTNKPKQRVTNIQGNYYSLDIRTFEICSIKLILYQIPLIVNTSASFILKLIQGYQQIVKFTGEPQITLTTYSGFIKYNINNQTLIITTTETSVYKLEILYQLTPSYLQIFAGITIIDRSVLYIKLAQLYMYQFKVFAGQFTDSIQFYQDSNLASQVVISSYQQEASTSLIYCLIKLPPSYTSQYYYVKTKPHEFSKQEQLRQNEFQYLLFNNEFGYINCDIPAGVIISIHPRSAKCISILKSDGCYTITKDYLFMLSYHLDRPDLVAIFTEVYFGQQTLTTESQLITNQYSYTIILGQSRISIFNSCFNSKMLITYQHHHINHGIYPTDINHHNVIYQLDSSYVELQIDSQLCQQSHCIVRFLIKQECNDSWVYYNNYIQIQQDQLHIVTPMQVEFIVKSMFEGICIFTPLMGQIINIDSSILIVSPDKIIQLKCEFECKLSIQCSTNNQIIMNNYPLRLTQTQFSKNFSIVSLEPIVQQGFTGNLQLLTDSINIVPHQVDAYLWITRNISTILIPGQYQHCLNNKSLVMYTSENAQKVQLIICPVFSQIEVTYNQQITILGNIGQIRCQQITFSQNQQKHNINMVTQGRYTLAYINNKIISIQLNCYVIFDPSLSTVQYYNQETTQVTFNSIGDFQIIHDGIQILPIQQFASLNKHYFKLFQLQRGYYIISLSKNVQIGQLSCSLSNLIQLHHNFTMTSFTQDTQWNFLLNDNHFAILLIRSNQSVQFNYNEPITLNQTQIIVNQPSSLIQFNTSISDGYVQSQIIEIDMLDYECFSNQIKSEFKLEDQYIIVNLQLPLQTVECNIISIEFTLNLAKYVIKPDISNSPTSMKIPLQRSIKQDNVLLVFTYVLRNQLVYVQKFSTIIQENNINSYPIMYVMIIIIIVIILAIRRRCQQTIKITGQELELQTQEVCQAFSNIKEDNFQSMFQQNQGQYD